MNNKKEREREELHKTIWKIAIALDMKPSELVELIEKES